MGTLRIIVSILLLCVLALVLAGCQSGSGHRVFDPHVGTWEGQALGSQASEEDGEPSGNVSSNDSDIDSLNLGSNSDGHTIQLTLLPGGIMQYLNTATGQSEDFAYWVVTDDEDGWRMDIMFYPVSETRDDVLAAARLSSDAPETLLFSANEAGQGLLGFAGAELTLTE